VQPILASNYLPSPNKKITAMNKIYIYLIALAISLPALADGGEPLPEYSPNYIAFDEDNWELLSYNRLTGSGVIGFTTDPPPFQAGLSITNIASDTMGYFLRRITQAEQIGNTLHIQTIKADMEDVFLNKSFVLSSTVMPPNNPNTNGMSNEEISRAMTSAKGHIHPVEIIYHYGGENRRFQIEKINLLDPNNPYAGRSSDTFNVFHVYELWEDYELFSTGNLQFVLDEAMLSFKADAILAFDFRARPASDTTIIKDGQLDRVTFTIEGEAMAKADLSLTATVEYETEEEEVELYTDIISVTQKFFVGPVIVWVTFSLDLLADYFVHAHAEVQATWGFEASQTVVIGGSFLPPTNDWVPIFEEEFSYEITPIEVTGEASVDAKLMIYPRAKLFLYSAAGPYADLVPWAGANFAATAMVNTDGDTDLKWNANIDLGLDQRIGIKPAWLESLIGQLGPWVDTLYYDRIWEAPHKLALTTKLENSYVLPVTIPLQFRVSDNLGFRTPLTPVFFEASHGEISKEWAVCNLAGIATVDWTFDEENFDQSQEIHTLSASLINAEDETIQSIQVRVSLNTKTTACYIEELSNADSVIFEDVVFTGIQKGIFANDKNLASLRLNEVTFEDCESAITGHFGNVEVTHNTSFENCQTAMHVTGTDPPRNRLTVYNAEFDSISLMGIYFMDMFADIRYSNFQAVKTAIQGNGGRERDAVAFIIDVAIDESENAVNVNNLEYVFLRDVEIKRAGVPDSTTMYTALSAENIWQVDIESVNIENYFNAFYGSHFRATNRIGKMKVLNCIRGIDLRNVTNTNIFENLIKLDHAVGPESAMRDEYFGIYLRNSDKNQIARNNLINLCTAIKQMGCESNTLSANSFWGCQCDETGIRSDASNTRITNNNFEGNAGAALLFENATAWVIANNNFIENQYGIQNLTSANTIEGHGNYFSGQLGANTAGNVQTYNDLDEKVSLLCDFMPDTLFIPYGRTDSIGLHVQNFVHLNDSVIINISEELDWISNGLVHYLALKDSLGGMIYVRFEIPAYDPDAPLPQNAQTVLANLISVPYTNTAVDSIIVFVYEQQLDSLYILPEEQTIFVGDSIKFNAQSIDQHGIPIETGIVWQASEGIIDDTGWLFTPDEFEGEIIITATDTLSGIAAYGTVMVTDEWPMLQHIEIKPAIAELKPHQSIKFQAYGFNQFGYAHHFVPAWEASGGLINNDGFYLAPDSTGIYSIMVHSLYDGMSGDALARIRCFTYTDEYHMLCGSDSVLINNEWIKTAGLYNDTIFNPGYCDQVRTWEVVKFELPDVQIALPPIVCEGSDAFELTGGTPAGGTYSGTGVDANGWFDPAVSGTGSFEISYTYTDANTCTATATEIIQVDPILEVDVSITADDTVICAGETVHFSSLAVNPGSSPLYQWLVNGIQQGDNSPVFSYAPADNDEVSLVLTSSKACTSGNPAISNIISISVNPVHTASVSITSTQTEVCENTEVGFTAEIQNGGNNPVFQWYVNGNTAGTNNAYFSYTPDHGDEVHVILESNLVCVEGSPAISNSSIISVVANLPVTVSIETDETQVCEGTEVTFTATAVNGGNDPVFHWMVNGSHTGNNSDTFSYVPAGNDVVNVILTSSETCASDNPATSNSINMQLIPLLEVGISIEADAASVCEGETLTFMATAMNGGDNPEYQWQLNGVNTGSNSHIFSYAPSQGDEINAILTSSAECVHNNPAVSNTITTIVNPPITALVSIEASAIAICEGESVVYTATTINGGADPVFQWQVNGNNAGTNNPEFIYTPLDGDEVSLVLTSSESCVTNNPVTSDTLVMTVLLNVDVDVFITANATEVCEGELVHFTATALNGGTNPAYEWKVNGVNTGTNSPMFNYLPSDNDNVMVMLISSISCANNNPAMSETINMTVNPIPEVSWAAFEPDTLCIFWAAIPLYGGLPEGGNYTGNGVENSAFDPETAGPGQHIITYHYTSEHGCYNTAQYILFVEYCTYIHSGMDARNHIFVYPNPAHEYVIIQIEDHILIANDLSYQLIDVFGRVLSAGELTATHNRISMEAIIAEVIFVRIENKGKLIKYFKLVKMQ
jgi:hypothetical protein